MLFFTLGLNFVVPQMTAPSSFGFGGGGGVPDLYSAEQAQEAAPPAAAELATEAPLDPSVLMAPVPTQTVAPAADSAREIETPVDKQGVTNETQVQEAAPVPAPLPPPVPQTWQIALAAIAVVGALIMMIMRQSAASRWRK